MKNISNGEFYAMKVLDKRRIVKLKQVDHTLYEKNILAGVKFPFLVNLEFFYKDNSYLYFIMPFVNGGELFTHLRRYNFSIIYEIQSNFDNPNQILVIEKNKERKVEKMK